MCMVVPKFMKIRMLKFLLVNFVWSPKCAAVPKCPYLSLESWGAHELGDNDAQWWWSFGVGFGVGYKVEELQHYPKSEISPVFCWDPLLLVRLKNGWREGGRDWQWSCKRHKERLNLWKQANSRLSPQVRIHTGEVERHSCNLKRINYFSDKTMGDKDIVKEI